MDKEIGTDIDLKVANKLGLKLAQVQRRREDLGVSPFYRITEDQKTSVRTLHEQGLSLKAVSARTGISYSSVQRFLSTKG